MDVHVKAKSSFVHGKFNMRKGDTALIPDAIAKELQKAGLVELKANAPSVQAGADAGSQPTTTRRRGAAPKPAVKKDGEAQNAEDQQPGGDGQTAEGEKPDAAASGDVPGRSADADDAASSGTDGSVGTGAD